MILANEGRVMTMCYLHHKIIFATVPSDDQYSTVPSVSMVAEHL